MWRRALVVPTGAGADGDVSFRTEALIASWAMHTTGSTIKAVVSEDFYRAHVARHQSAANRWVVFVSDHVLIVSLLLLLRKRKLGLRLYGGALIAIVAGHVLFERNAQEELSALVKNPLASLAAERRFLAGMWHTGPAAFNPAVD